MTALSVIYPKHSGTTFDHDYYMHKHIPMVKTLLGAMGLQDLQLLRGTTTLAGEEPVYEMVEILTFPDEQKARTAMEQSGQQILDDVPNFTDMKAAIQLNEPVS